MLFFLACARPVAADTLLLANGDLLSGDLLRADAGGVTFHCPQLGDLHVAWQNIEELTTQTIWVAVTNRMTIQGELSARGAAVVITPSPGRPVSLHANELREIVTPAELAVQLAAAQTPWWRGWQGSVAAGFSVVKATQSANSYTTDISFRRNGNRRLAEPPRSNTLVSYRGSYGSVSQPHVPTVLSSIYTAAFEQDQNLSPAFFVLGRAQYDHNFAQGLQLQQSYGGGLGWKPINNANAQLDLKSGLHFTHQKFLTAPSASFLASDFSESFRRRLRSAMTWTENIGVSPAVTQGNAYQAAANTSLVIPVYKLLSFNMTVADSYLGNPQPGFRHNSLQFSSGMQLSIP